MCNRPGTENDNEWRNDQQNNTFSFLFRLRDFSHRLTKDIIQGFCYWRNHIQSESRPTRDVVKLNATLACKCLSPGRIPFAVSELNGDALLTSFSYAVNIAQAVGQGLFGPAMCERSNVKAREREGNTSWESLCRVHAVQQIAATNGHYNEKLLKLFRFLPTMFCETSISRSTDL